MASWLLPALKAVLPHVGSIISAASPHFTKKKPEQQPANDASGTLVQQQITELQNAVQQNSKNIHELAMHLEKTVNAIEQTAAIADAKLRRALLLAVAGIILSVVAIGLALFPHIAR